MIPIIFPPSNFKVRFNEKTSNDEIFDLIRKKWLVLTPEEWVRQNFVNYLVTSLNYPASLIALEKGIKVGELNKRFDIVVYNNQAQPVLLIECKAPDVVLNQNTVQQVLSYKSVLNASYLIITNGHYTYGFYTDNQMVEQITEIPVF